MGLVVVIVVVVPVVGVVVVVVVVIVVVVVVVVPVVGVVVVSVGIILGSVEVSVVSCRCFFSLLEHYCKTGKNLKKIYIYIETLIAMVTGKTFKRNA